MRFLDIHDGQGQRLGRGPRRCCGDGSGLVARASRGDAQGCESLLSQWQSARQSLGSAPWGERLQHCGKLQARSASCRRFSLSGTTTRPGIRASTPRQASLPRASTTSARFASATPLLVRAWTFARSEGLAARSAVAEGSQHLRRHSRIGCSDARSQVAPALSATRGRMRSTESRIVRGSSFLVTTGSAPTGVERETTSTSGMVGASLRT